MKRYILALDEGTTSARAILFDENLTPVATAQHQITQIYPKPGWVEQDAVEIYANQYSAMTECIAKSGVDPSEISAIGITNQRETTIVWDKLTGKPISNAIVWQCRRTADICRELEAKGLSDYVLENTGLKIDAYFSATKIKWILDNVEGAREKAEKGELLFGTVDTYLIWKLTGGKVHATDYTNASRTMLFNIKTGLWDDKLVSELQIPSCMLPEVKSSSEIYGYVDVMGATLKIAGVAGDQQAALFGQGCFKDGDVKSTYGTGCFILMHTGLEKIVSKNGLVTTLAANEKGKPLEYALEGSVFVGGAVIQWLRDELRLISDSRDSEYFAKKVEDSGGVYVVPAFSGLGAPYWDMDARGTITGITRGTKRAHIIRAAVESIAYQCDDVIRAMAEDLGKPLSAIKADGGASENGFLMQFQSDISGVTVIKPYNSEATALGAAALAGLAAREFKSKEEIAIKLSSGKSYQPSIDKDKRKELVLGWQNAIKKTRA